MPAEVTPPVAAPPVTPTAPETPPVATPPAAEQTPAPAPPAETPPAETPPIFDFTKTFLEGLGVAVGETPKVEPVVAEKSGRTLAERLKEIDEERAAAAANPPATPAVTPPPAETPAAETPPAPPPATPPKVEVEVRPSTETIVEATVRKVLEQQQKPAEPPAPTKPPEAPASDPFEATLTEGEREEMAFARYAAKKDPAKFGDLPDRTLGSFKKTAAYIESARQKDPERTFDENDEEFAKFIRSNRPTISPIERRKLDTARMRDEVRSELKQEQNADLEEIRKRQHLLEATPKIERGTAEYSAGVQAFIAGDDKSEASPILKVALEQGWQKARESDPLFAPIAHDIYAQSVNLASEYLAIIEGVKPFDQKNQGHVWLLKFVRQQGEAFARDGGDAKVRDGRTFLPLAEFNELAQKDPARASNHFTFSPRDVLERLAGNTKYNIDKTISEERLKLEKAGFKREKPAATPPVVPTTPAQPAKQAPAEAPRSAPKAAPSASPGAAQTTVNAPLSFGSTILAAMGVKQ